MLLVIYYICLSVYIPRIIRGKSNSLMIIQYEMLSTGEYFLKTLGH